ncbi:MAG: iron-containing alcohol dehydrogenase, partial [Myxococcota bacterium]|nr:iron-containing alcohol dehydrogenase [Myxococcota bacterium]
VWAPDGTKSSVDHPAGFADRAYIDPLLTASMPTRLTAAVGLDALTHAMESLWGRHATPTSSKFAARAIELIHPNLVEVARSPNQQGRDALTLGSVLAGMALSQTRSAIAHALSYQLTGEFGIEHGLAVGLIALAVLRLDEADAPKERVRVVQAGGGRIETLTDVIEQIFSAIDHHPSLNSFGVPDSGIEAIVETALRSNRLGNMAGTWQAAELNSLLQTIR